MTHILRQCSESYVGLIYVNRPKAAGEFEHLLAAGIDASLKDNYTTIELKAAIAGVQSLCAAKAELAAIHASHWKSEPSDRQESASAHGRGMSPTISLQNQLRLEFKRAQRYQQNLVLLLLKLDDHCEDSRTELDGSQSAGILATISHAVRFEIDFAGRSGSREFFVILPETDIDGAIAVAERMRSAIARSHKSRDSLDLGCSVGVAHFNGDRGNFETPEEFYLTAKAAKDAAVAHGGDQYWALDTPRDIPSHQSA